MTGFLLCKNTPDGPGQRSEGSGQSGKGLRAWNLMEKRRPSSQSEQTSSSAPSGPTGCQELTVPGIASLGRAAAVPLLRPAWGKAIPRLDKNQGLRSPLAGPTLGLCPAIIEQASTCQLGRGPWPGPLCCPRAQEAWQHQRPFSSIVPCALISVQKPLKSRKDHVLLSPH